MKKVLIIESSPRKGFTRAAAEKLADKLGGSAQIETIHVYEEEIAMCGGCCACLIAGSLKCPHHGDSAKKILDKMMAADGVIYLIPNYALQVPAGLKNLLDRLAFVFHRPRLFGKKTMVIVVEGVYGSRGIIKYVNEAMTFWGMETVKGTALTGGVYPGRDPDRKTAETNDRKLEDAAQRFLKALNSERPQIPSIMQVFLFRAQRTGIRESAGALPADKAYFSEKGWFESPYYYPVRIGLAGRAAGSLADMLIGRQSRNGKS